MEHPNPHFIDSEQREHIDFYRTWVGDVLRGEIAGVDDLIALRKRFTLDRYDQRVVHDMGIDTEMLDGLLEEINSKIQGRVAETAEELVYNVFLANLFSVGVRVGEEVRLVEGLEIYGDRILPRIDGEPYDGSIDDVIFDR